MCRQYDHIDPVHFVSSKTFIEEAIEVFFFCLEGEYMSLLISIFMIVIGFVFLTKGADLFVSNASGVAKKLHVSPLVIGLTIVAFGTSMPELAVSVTAALEGSNEIAVGNVVGSNIFNLLVVAGLSACLFPLAKNRILMKRDWPLSGIMAIILAIFLLDSHISRLEGCLLLVCFGFTLFKQLTSGEPVENQEEETRPMSKLVVLLLIGIAAIVIGGQVTVDGATELARILGLSETLIGLTIVAIGTSLPELVTSVVAAKMGENEIAMGNVIGSNLFNIMFILGVSSVLNPISVEATAFIDTCVLVVITFVFWFIAQKMEMGKKFGLPMILVYILYTIYIILR